MPNAEVSRADGIQFQSWLHARQYPADCSGSVGMYTRQDYFYSLGLGAQMVSLKYGLLWALLQGSVYHFPTSHYVNPVRCASRSFDCYFEPPSNCTRPTVTAAIGGGGKGGGRRGRQLGQRSPAELRRRRPWLAATTGSNRSQHRAAEEVKIHWCFDLPRRRLTRMAQLRGVHPASWYLAQLSAFLFRPNLEMRQLRDEVSANMESSASAPDTSASSDTAASSDSAAASAASAASRNTSAQHGAGSCVAMHVRRTDKHTEDHRVRDRSFKDFGQVYRSWAYWRYGGPVAQLRVLLGSEDKATFSAVPRLLVPSSAYWIPARHFVMDMSLGKAFKSIKQGNSRLAELYGLLEDQVAAARPPPTRQQLAAQGLLKDEGMVLILQMLLMSECVAFIGSFSSNVAILVHDLMLARRAAQGEELHAIDVNGRVYCGCGASFCMQLERKAIRETGRPVKQIVEGFRY